MRVLFGAVLAIALAGCGIHEPQTVVSERGVAADPRVTVDGSTMVTLARPSPGPCAAYSVPIDGARAFEAEISNAVSAALGARTTRISVTGKRVTARFSFEPRTTGSLNASPAITLDAEVSIDGDPPSPVQWTGSATGPVTNVCGGLGPVVADAYRNALHGLATQLRERIAARFTP